ncbi:hypothetical protein F53441_3375 [Fusarium austroafricanum]|uniref:Uncharacterized protein n=1 Tax=Fusarium austroafricanum TaxID=2364996 RepID=A0A8H4P2T9_9HYPO|nr:hypothetical protein F53441_3375 [Fusarium austroafricanum]
MEDASQNKRDTSPTPSSSHRRTPSNSSILSKFPFLRTSPDKRHDQPNNAIDNDIPATSPRPAVRPSASVIQYQRTRRRRGSLRKVALLGRGAQRERRESRPLVIDTSHAASYGLDPNASQTESPSPIDSLDLSDTSSNAQRSLVNGFTPLPEGLGTASVLPQAGTATQTTARPTSLVDQDGASYTSTDDEDMLQIPGSSSTIRQGLSMTSGQDSYFSNLGSTSSHQRRRPANRAKSPLSFSGLSSNTLPVHEDWDYAETEWWGWVVLCVTWFVFVVGMGSCLDLWSWAWDVGKTPYAPPEFEDDDTLPIVGYYPALIILTGVMAWVWVVVAWVGMKYFRHAKISGD